MELNVVDIFIFLFLLMGGIVGYKNGAIKEGTKFIGFFIIVIISFLLKDRLMVFLYQNLPFFNFFGLIKGLDAINILLYQLISFIIIFIALFFILKVLLVITGVIEWLVRMTVFLNLPSKILGMIIGVIEYYIYIFICLFIIAMPIFNLTFVAESKFANNVLNNTPILSNMVEGTVDVYTEVWNLIKTKNDKNRKEINTLVLATLLDNNLITIESVRDLIESNKVIVDDSKFLDDYVEDGDLYDKIKEVYYVLHITWCYCNFFHIPINFNWCCFSIFYKKDKQ